MTETIKERLMYYARQVHDRGQNRFEVLCGIPKGTINAIGKGISTATLEKILKTCPDLNANWLVTGVGDMQNLFVPGKSGGNGFEVAIQGKKSEKRGLDDKVDEIEFLRFLCKRQQEMISLQQTLINELTSTMSNL